MYYWISWGIHAALVLVVAAVAVLSLRYMRLKPKIRKTLSDSENMEKREITAADQNDEAVDLDTLYKSRKEL